MKCATASEEEEEEKFISNISLLFFIGKMPLLY